MTEAVSVEQLPPPVAAAVASTRESRRPWVEKYRPAQLDQVVAHDQILATLRRFMENNAMPHLLFYGPPGTGKTTTIQACARHLFGGRVKGNVLELNASDDRGIDVVRNEIKEFASTSSIGGSSGFFGASSTLAAASSTPAPTKSTFKLIVLDEADQMSHDAQAALRRVIERYTKNVRFCIICNHVNKIIPAVQSRCTRFRFAPVQKASMVPRLTFIAEQEALPFTPEGIAAAFRLSYGDMRRCLNLMQACALAACSITEDSVYDVSGAPRPSDIQSLGSTMLSMPFSDAFSAALALVESKGISMTDVVREMHVSVQSMSLPQECKWFAAIELASIEHQLASGTTESMALAGVLGVMQLIKEAVTQQKSIFELAAL